MNRLLLSAVALSLTSTLLPGCGNKEVKDDPKEVHRLPPKAEEWRKQRPASGPVPELQMPTFERAVLDNGMVLLVAQAPSLPIVDVRVVVRAGAAQEPAKKAGLASLTFDLLDEGAGKLDAMGLSDAAQDLGTRISTDAGRESGSVHMGLLKRNLDDGMKLLASVVKEPSFNKDDFKRVQQRTLAGLVQKAGSPQTIAFETAASSLFGDKHAYGHPTSGSTKTVKGLKVSDVKKFWGQVAGPKNAALIAAGDITLDELKALAETHFGKWKSRAKPIQKTDDVVDLETLSVKAVPFPGAAQTVVLVGRPLLKKGDADEVPAMLFNAVLGGMFSSRLNMNLREDKHYSYGAFSYVVPRTAKGAFLAGAAVEAQHTQASLQEILKEFDTIAKTPISDDELAAAKQNFTKSLPGYFETVGAMGGAAESIFLYDLELTHYSSLPQKIEAVTVADVQRVAQAACKREGLHVVLVGPKEHVVEPIQKLELGDFEERAIPAP